MLNNRQPPNNPDNDPDPFSYLSPVESLLQPDGLTMDASTLDVFGRATSNEYYQTTSPSLSGLEIRSPEIADNSLASWTPPKKPGKKRGRPKSTRLIINSPKNAPNLYCLLNSANEQASMSAAPVGSPSMAPGDVFSGGAGIGPDDDSYAWMSEQRGKRRRSPAISCLPLPASHQVLNSTPIIDSLTADPALMASLGMRPSPTDGTRCSSLNGAMKFSPENLKMPILTAKRSEFQSSKMSNAPTKQPSPLGKVSMEATVEEPSEFYMDELFQELLVNPEPLQMDELDNI